MTSKNRRTNEDRLSNLPEEILTNVLSLLPMKQAVRTSILSKRWRYSWMLVSNLDFENVTPHKFVDQVLEFRKSKVEILRMHIFEWPVSKPTISKWINEAVRLNVSELDIRFRQVDLPLSFFICRTLTTFRLKFYFQSEPLWACPSLVSLPCLKTLDIVVYSNPLENAFKLIHGCPILENLSLEVTTHKCEEGYYFHIPTLKRLTLSILGSLKSDHKVELNLPNLEYLSIRQDLLHSLFVIKELSSLVEAKVSCSTVYYQQSYELLKGICRAKCLSLDICYSSFLFNNPLSSSLPEFPNVKHLELWSFHGFAWLLVPKILEKCSQLEHFCIHEPYIRAHCSNEEPESFPRCILANLKTIKVTNSMMEKTVLQVLKFMLVNSKVLKTLTVTFDTCLPLKDVDVLSQVIYRLPRASEDCEINFETNRWYV